MSEYPKLGHATQRAFQILQRVVRSFDGRILDLPATNTGEVVVIPRLAIEPLLRMARFNLVDQPRGAIPNRTYVLSVL